MTQHDVAPRPVDDLPGILARARQAGIDPWRVVIALGIDHRTIPEDMIEE